MLDITEIKKQYPNSLHTFDRDLLREYLQYNILSIIFSHKISSKLSFLGGTCLRIVYGLKRFSEDIDFDNKDLTQEEFEELGYYVEKELEKAGFNVEIKFISKDAFHYHIKFPGILYEQGLSPFREEKILIKLDTFDQGFEYESEIFILDKFEFYKQIKTTPKDIILSQKLWTITQRNRLKGRDFYDIMFLLQNTKPNKGFLEAKFGTSKISKILETINNTLNETKFEALAKDVEPFLIEKNAKELIINFETFLNQQLKD